jgi:ribonuclease BN (tRNA processing enzyme)
LFERRKYVSYDDEINLLVPQNVMTSWHKIHNIIRETDGVLSMSIILNDWLKRSFQHEINLHFKTIEELKKDKIPYVYDVEGKLINHLKLTSRFNDIRNKVNGLAIKLNLNSLETIHVEHTANSCGFKIVLKNNFSLVYSGDCRPSKSLMNLGQNCDLLIHEATYSNDRKTDAIANFHSTVSEALEVGMQMNAKHVILTHISNRELLVLPPYDIRQINAGMAFDNMKINRKNIHLLSSFNEALHYSLSNRFVSLLN